MAEQLSKRQNEELLLIKNLTSPGTLAESFGACVPPNWPSMEAAFAIPLITKKIMGYLSHSDLIACSTLNRLWYSATRSQDLCARVCNCYSLEHWRYHMTAMSRPFTLLYFKATMGSCQEKSRSQNFADIPLKKVMFYGTPSCQNFCPSHRFLSQLFAMQNLQELSLTSEWLGNISPTWANQMQNSHILGNLRVLQIVEKDVEIEVVVHLISFLVEIAPRLQYLDCYVTPKQALSVAKTKPWVIKYVTFLPPKTSQDEALYEQFALLEPKLWGLRASRSDMVRSMWMWMKVEVYLLSNSAWNTLRRLLLSTCSSLRQLAIGSYVAEKLAQDNELKEAVFPNAKGMILDIDIPAGVECLGALEFQRTFPQLSSVIVRPERAKFHGDDPQNLNSSSITEIVLLYNPRYRVIGCSRLFPYVTSLALDDYPCNTDILLEACKAWPRLKRFRLGDGTNLCGLKPYELDAMLCGMTLSEAEDMSRKGAEFLKKVNFVHGDYSLVNLTELELVEITFAQPYCDTEVGELMTRITPYLTLRHLPHLKFIINCLQRQAISLRPLLPLVTINIVSKERGNNFHSWKRHD